MRRVETTRRDFKAAEFHEEGVQPDKEESCPRKPNEEAPTNKKGPRRSWVWLQKGILVQIVREGSIGHTIIR
jgi:hypothetical protein